MKTRYIYITFFIFSTIGCLNSSLKDREQIKKIENIKISKNNSLRIFDNCNNYKNNLSSYVSKIEFVKLDTIFNSFLVSDIKITSKYIFAIVDSKIFQYSRKGKFITVIGSRGQGPREYLNLFPPLEIDEKRELIYATDIRKNNIYIYNFKNKFIGSIPLKNLELCSSFTIIDSNTIAYRQADYHRYMPFCKQIYFSDFNGKITKTYNSKIYPIPKKRMQSYGPPVSFLWKYKTDVFHLEYGADTIYKIMGDSLMVSRIIGGKLRLYSDEYFKKRLENERFEIVSGIQRPDCGIFESDSYVFFRMQSGKEKYFKICDKRRKKYYRTHYSNATTNRRGIAIMDYFVDDLITGLSFNPQYQSDEKIIGFISIEEIMNKKDEILRFIRKKGNLINSKIENIINRVKEEDNDILIFVEFK